MSTQASTPLPWRVHEHSTFVHSPLGNICACGDPHASGYVGYTEPKIGSQFLGEAVANAALIVRAVNSHADMLAALTLALFDIDAAITVVEHDRQETAHGLRQTKEKIEAAIAKARP